MTKKLHIIRLASMFIAALVGTSCLDAAWYTLPPAKQAVKNAVGRVAKQSSSFSFKPRIGTIISPDGVPVTAEAFEKASNLLKRPMNFSKRASLEDQPLDIEFSKSAWEYILKKNTLEGTKGTLWKGPLWGNPIWPHVLKNHTPENTKGPLWDNIIKIIRDGVPTKAPQAKSFAKSEPTVQPQTQISQSPMAPLNAQLFRYEGHKYLELRSTKIHKNMLYKRFFPDIPSTLSLPQTVTENLPTRNHKAAHLLQFFPKEDVSSPPKQDTQLQLVEPSPKPQQQVTEFAEAPPKENSEQRLVELGSNIVEYAKHNTENGSIFLRTGKGTYEITAKEHEKIQKLIQNLFRNRNADLTKEPVVVPLESGEIITIDFSQKKLIIRIEQEAHNNSLVHKNSSPAIEYSENIAVEDTAHAITLAETRESEIDKFIQQPDVLVEQPAQPAVKSTPEPCLDRPYYDADATSETIPSTPTPPLAQQPTQAAQGNVYSPTPIKKTPRQPNPKTKRRVPHGDTAPHKSKGAFSTATISAPIFNKYSSHTMQKKPSAQKITGPLPSPNADISEEGLNIKEYTGPKFNFTKTNGQIRRPNLPATTTEIYNDYTYDATAPLVGLFTAATQLDKEEDKDKNSNEKDSTPLIEDTSSLIDDEPTEKSTVESCTELGTASLPPAIKKPSVGQDGLPNGYGMDGIIYHGEKFTTKAKPKPKSTGDEPLEKLGDIEIPPITKSMITSIPDPISDLDTTKVHDGRRLQFDAKPTSDIDEKNKSKPDADATDAAPKNEEHAKKAADDQQPAANTAGEAINNPVEAKGKDSHPGSGNNNSHVPATFTLPRQLGAHNTPKASPTADKSQPMFNPATPAASPAPMSHSPASSNYQTPAAPIEKLKDAPGVTNDRSLGTNNPQHVDPATLPLYPNVPAGHRQATHNDGSGTTSIQTPAGLSKISFPTLPASNAIATTSSMPIQGTAPHNGVWGNVLGIGLYLMGIFNIAAGSISTRWLRGILRLLGLSPA